VKWQEPPPGVSGSEGFFSDGGDSSPYGKRSSITEGVVKVYYSL